MSTSFEHALKLTGLESIQERAGQHGPWRSKIPRSQTARFRRSVLLMIRGYQGDELWTVVNPLTGKREVIEPEGEFLPGETIIKLYYLRQIDGYVTIPGHSLFKVAADGYMLEPAD